jgi:hypothetical protein
MSELGAKLLVLSFVIGAFVSFVRWIDSQPVEPLTRVPSRLHRASQFFADGLETKSLRPPPPGPAKV